MAVFITSTGSFFPGEPVSNDEMEARLGRIGTKPSRLREKILQQNRIEQRYYAIDERQQTIFSNAQMAASWVSRLGITMEQLNAFDTTIGIANGSALYYDVEVQAGDFLSVWVNFVANDYWPYDDFAFFSASSEALDTPDIQVLGRVDAVKDMGVGDMGTSGYYNLTYNFTADGLYTLGFGVVNAGPAPLDFDVDPTPLMSDSALLLDQNNAPEPSTWILTVSVFATLFLLRRRSVA